MYFHMKQKVKKSWKFRCKEINNNSDNYSEDEIEIWEYPEHIKCETMINLSQSRGKISLKTL